MDSGSHSGRSHLHKKVGSYLLGRTIGEVRGDVQTDSARDGSCQQDAPGRSSSAASARTAVHAGFSSATSCCACGQSTPPTRTIRMALPQGTYAKVKYGQHADSGEAVAVKVLDKEQLVRSGMVEQIKREITILKQVGCGADGNGRHAIKGCVLQLPGAALGGGRL